MRKYSHEKYQPRDRNQYTEKGLKYKSIDQEDQQELKMPEKQKWADPFSKYESELTKPKQGYKYSSSDYEKRIKKDEEYQPKRYEQEDRHKNIHKIQIIEDMKMLSKATNIRITGKITKKTHTRKNTANICKSPKQLMSQVQPKRNQA